MLYIIKGVAGRLLVKAVDCGSKGPGFQSHLEQRFLLWVHSVLPQKLSRTFFFTSFRGDIKLSVLGNPLKLAQVLLGIFLLTG